MPYYDLAATGGIGGAGDVVGPVGAVGDNFPAFDTTTGKLLYDSGASAGTFATAAQGSAADSAIQAETDPVVGGVVGLVMADGLGTISAATPGTDYQAPLAAGTDYLAPNSTVDGTYAVYNDGSTSGQLSSITIAGGLVIDLTILP